VKKDEVLPKAIPTVEVFAKNWRPDNWLGLTSSLKVISTGPIWISLFLPEAKNAPETKKVAVFDGEMEQVIEVERNKMISVGPFSSNSGKIDLHFVCAYSEPGIGTDQRQLGAVLLLKNEEGEKLYAAHQESPLQFGPLMDHPDASIVSLEFDAHFYLRHFKYGDYPDNLLMHYLLLGWQTGYGPNANFSVAEFSTDELPIEMPKRNPLALDILKRRSSAKAKSNVANLDAPRDEELYALWHDLAGPVAESRPDFRFDASFYSKQYADAAASDMLAEDHFRKHGIAKNRSGNLFDLMGVQISDLRQKLSDLLHHQELKALVNEGRPGALELAFELSALGSPVDENISDFSERFYLESYKDIRDAGTVPFLHYLNFGLREGRQTLAALRSKCVLGKQVFDASLPTCLICTHEFSKTGAPMVALDMVKEASLTHNVIVAALRSGELQPAFAPYCVVMLVTDSVFEDYRFFPHEALSKIDFAILNSVECWAYSKFLVSRNIPYASYIHEYTDYTRPSYKAKFICWFSDVIIYSSNAVRDSWKSAFQEAGFDVLRDSSVIPQHRLIDGSVTENDYLAARARISELLSIDCTHRRIIYGAGQIQIRKGTDLFVMAAQQAAAIDPDAIFIWIGDGRNHDDLVFGVWLEKHLREASANTKKSNLFFFPAGPHYLDLCKAADAMFMSSRIDPLPNVVFDATRNGAAVVLFEGASGFDDAVYSESTLLHLVEFGRLDSACAKLLKIPRKEVQANGEVAVCLAPIEVPRKEDEAPSVGPFSEIHARLEERLGGEYITQTQADLYDVPMMYRSDVSHAEFRKAERAKVRRYGRQMVWNSPEEAIDVATEKGGWAHKGTQILTYEDFPEAMDVPAFSIHNHAFYLDGLENEIANYAFYHHAQRIVFTTDTHKKAEKIRNIGIKQGLEIETLVVVNQGRDILPFINLVAEDHEAKDDAIWCHIHRKQSVQSATTGEVWWSFLMRILAGGDRAMSSALREIAEKDVGLVTAFDPYIVGWDDSSRLLEQFSDRFPQPLPAHPVMFPVGNMFWVKTGVVRKMQGIFGSNYPWPNEPIANDGTEYHLIERLWPAATKMAGLSSCFIDKKGQKRA
jgi:glycosyltransferase involved in cell wall biosynthesis